MGTRKKCTELVFNLQWRNMPDNGGDRSNIVGMYDTPATTSNFETFKSYLLKNSGVVGNDVKVTYLTDNGAQWVIDSQQWFEIALCAFRLKARLGEVIFLKLDKISDSNQVMLRKDSNDAGTQFDHESTNNNLKTPPEWFLAYMEQFKKDVVEEITRNVKKNFDVIENDEVTTPEPAPLKTKRLSEAVSAEDICVPVKSLPLKQFKLLPSSSEPSLAKPEPSKPSEPIFVPVILPPELAQTADVSEMFAKLNPSTRLPPPPNRMVEFKMSSPKENVQSSIGKKTKSESKRSKKHLILGETPVDKDLLKTLKLDRKFENKLDRLDAKTKKLKEKKQALLSKLENSGNTRIKHPYIPLDEEGTPLMNGSVASQSVPIIPRMLGGETYLHSWEVINNGRLPWTAGTKLRLTWGSADMKPASNEIQCPSLKPGEKATICVRFQIPKNPGMYESYWNFYDRDVRFGSWLSCCVVVEDPASYLCEKDFFDIQQQEVVQQELQQQQSTYSKASGENSEQQMKFDAVIPTESKNDVIDLSTRMQEVTIETDSDSDWEGLVSYADLVKRAPCVEEKNDNDKPKSTNKYGINEQDLIVDLSTKENAASSSQCNLTSQNEPSENVNKQVEQTQNTIKDDDNNNGHPENNSSPRESFCEIGSDASDVSSGYDVVSVPVYEEDEEDSDYVHVTYNGKKITVPKHRVSCDYMKKKKRDFSGSIKKEDQEKIAKNEETIATPTTAAAAATAAAVEPEAAVCSTSKLEASIQDYQQSLASHCSTAGTCFSDVNPNESRIFVFPQNNPGFEIKYPKYEPNDGEFNELKVEAVDQNHFHAFDPYGLLDRSGTQEGAAAAAAALYQTNQNLQHISDYQQVTMIGLDQPNATQGGTAALEETNRKFQHVPNYQQSMPKATCKSQAWVSPPVSCFIRPVPPTAPPQQPSTTPQSPPPNGGTPAASPVQNAVPPVHILPENLVSGAVNVASSAINTARSVINMIVPKTEPGKWVNGHWVTENSESTRAKNLCILADMGFWDTDLNATLLARYNDDITRVVSELLQ